MSASELFVGDLCGYDVEGLDTKLAGEEDVLNKYRDCRVSSKFLNECTMIDYVSSLVHC